LLHNFLCPTWHGVADALFHPCLIGLGPTSLKQRFQLEYSTHVLSFLIGVKINSPFELTTHLTEGMFLAQAQGPPALICVSLGNDQS
jgi:hypothetical protein